MGGGGGMGGSSPRYRPPIVGTLFGEVHQQADAQPGGAEIGAHLCVVCRVEFFDRLEFDQDTFANDEVDSVASDELTVVFDGDLHLRLNRDATLAELDQ